jgi:hypothetical protein
MTCESSSKKYYKPVENFALRQSHETSMIGSLFKLVNSNFWPLYELLPETSTMTLFEVFFDFCFQPGQFIFHLVLAPGQGDQVPG